jgi:hypothetical protein
MNCDFSEVEIFFRNLISDNESFMFWHSFAEISTQNRNLQKWPININKLVYFKLRLYMSSTLNGYFPQQLIQCIRRKQSFQIIFT